jgi:hypothetical protein
MDLVEWDLIRDAYTDTHWVMETHVLGWDASTSQIRARLLVSLAGPLTPTEVLATTGWHAEVWRGVGPCYRDLDAAARRPAVYEVVAHLHDEVLEPTEGGSSYRTSGTASPCATRA